MVEQFITIWQLIYMIMHESQLLGYVKDNHKRRECR